MRYKHKCKDNDAILKFFEIDGFIDEVWIKYEFDPAWIVIGFDDLRTGLKLASEKFKKKRYPNTGIKK